MQNSMTVSYPLPLLVGKILTTFTGAHFQIYIVGGAVRDILMGKNPNDWDFTTDATPEQILALYPDGFYDNALGQLAYLSPKARMK